MNLIVFGEIKQARSDEQPPMAPILCKNRDKHSPSQLLFSAGPVVARIESRVTLTAIGVSFRVSFNSRISFNLWN
jgi:hypothetical protein